MFKFSAVKTIVLLLSLGVAMRAAWGQEVFRRADADGNGKIEITDPIRTLGYLFLGDPAPPCMDAADFDDNGVLEITDPVGTLSYLFQGSRPPETPGAMFCGFDPTEDSLDCEEYAADCGDAIGPLLSVSPTTLALNDGESADLTLRNIGEGTLEWTIASSARWVTSDGRRLVDAPLSNFGTGQGISAGGSSTILLEAFASGLPAGTTEGEITVSTNGGSVTVPATVTVTRMNLNGLWVGTFDHGEGKLLPTPGIALAIEQTGDDLAGKIDGRLAPALATSIRTQAGAVSFMPSEGSVAQGELDVSEVPAQAAVETWTLIASEDATWVVKGNRSGPQASTAAVDLPFTTSNGIKLLIREPFNGRSYQSGDRFRFDIGSRGYVEGELAGSVASDGTSTLTGTFALDPTLSGVRTGVTRTMTFTGFEIVNPNVLEANLRIIHTGLLSTRDVVTSGQVRLSKRQ